MNDILDRIFNRWTKWEVHESDKEFMKSRVNHATGFESTPHSVICDVMKRTNKYTGMIQYKTIEKQ